MAAPQPHPLDYGTLRHQRPARMRKPRSDRWYITLAFCTLAAFLATFIGGSILLTHVDDGEVTGPEARQLLDRVFGEMPYHPTVGSGTIEGKHVIFQDGYMCWIRFPAPTTSLDYMLAHVSFAADHPSGNWSVEPVVLKDLVDHSAPPWWPKPVRADIAGVRLRAFSGNPRMVIADYWLFFDSAACEGYVCRRPG